MSTKNEYRSLFAKLGFPLSVRDGTPEAQLAKAEANLEIVLPEALRDYYLVAGREKILNHVFNRLCRPAEWEIHAGKLIFMEENQTVVVWGLAATKKSARDPLVFQCPLVRGDLAKWYPEKIRCSHFLKFTIHLQAAYGGGMPHTASAKAPSDLADKIKSNWSFGGENGGMRVYRRENRAICVTKWCDFFSKQQSWRVFAGAKEKEDLSAIAEELGVQWDSA